MMEFLTIEQVTETYPGVFTKRLLYRMAQEGRIPSFKPGNQLVFRVKDLESYIVSRPSAGTERYRS